MKVLLIIGIAIVRMDKVEQNLGQQLKKTALLPLAGLYGFGTWVRNTLFQFGILKEKTFKIPVVSVGNITVGGTGKTPMVVTLAEHFFKQGKKVAVLSRGYGRNTSGFLWVNDEHDWQNFGDEPSLMQWKLKGKCLVAVDENRVHGINQILKEKPDIDIIILDDGYQHRYVKPVLNLLLCQFQKPFYSDVPLPAGNLREWRTGAKRADAVIVTKCPENLSESEKQQITQKIKRFTNPETPVFFAEIGYGALLPLFENLEPTPEPTNALVVTGIASPQPMYEYLQKKRWNLHALAYADHFKFEERHIHRIVQDWQKLDNKPIIITTEKDGVRLKIFHMLKAMNVYTLPIETKFKDWQAFKQFMYGKLFS